MLYNAIDTEAQSFIDLATAFIDLIKSGISLFAEPPLAYFVALGFTAAVIVTVKRLVPRKRAKG